MSPSPREAQRSGERVGVRGSGVSRTAPRLRRGWCADKHALYLRAMKKIALLVMAGSVLAVGCVSTGTFNKKVAQLQQVTADHDKAAAAREKALEAQIADLE